jgi:hypothetical protein
LKQKFGILESKKGLKGIPEKFVSNVPEIMGY